MKKLIVDLKGKENVLMSYEEVLKKYEPLLNKYAKRITIPGYGYEDILQEGSIALWEAFNTYDEKNAFIVHANWTIKDKLSNLCKKMTKTGKRGNEYDFLLSLDYEDGGEDSKSLSETIQDDFNIEEDYLNKDFLKFINDVIKDDMDKVIIQVVFGNKKNGQVAEELGISKHLVTTRARRLKESLQKSLVRYNPENVKYI